MRYSREMAPEYVSEKKLRYGSIMYGFEAHDLEISNL